MKKLFLLTLGALMSAVLWASPRSLQQARMAAPGMRHVHTMKVHGEPVMYVFDRPNEGGYMLISADDRAYTVLGYTDQGHWDANENGDSIELSADFIANGCLLPPTLPTARIIRKARMR